MQDTILQSPSNITCSDFPFKAAPRILTAFLFRLTYSLCLLNCAITELISAEYKLAIEENSYLTPCFYKDSDMDIFDCEKTERSSLLASSRE